MPIARPAPHRHRRSRHPNAIIHALVIAALTIGIAIVLAMAGK